MQKTNNERDQGNCTWVQMLELILNSGSCRGGAHLVLRTVAVLGL